jgi:xylan 1,4-beta-xylosidase
MIGSPDMIFNGSSIGLIEGSHLYQRNGWHYLLTDQQACVTTDVDFQPSYFQQMAGLVAYYNDLVFHELYLSHDESQGCCLPIHRCDDGMSSFPLGADIVTVPPGKIFLRAVFDDCCLRFYWSSDGETFQTIDRELDALMLAAEYGDHWGFTGTTGASRGPLGLHGDFCWADLSGFDGYAASCRICYFEVH